MAFKNIFTEFNDGVKTQVLFDEDTNEVIEQHSGVNDRQLKLNKHMQNSTSDWRKFDAKQELHPVLDMTMVDVMRLREHGIDMLGKVDWKYAYKVIEEHYPYMKMTTARLG